MQRISATEAARNFSELLNRVFHRGESFLIVRNGQEVGRLTPVGRCVTLSGLIQLVERYPVDEEFANDLEDIQRMQSSLPEDLWPT